MRVAAVLSGLILSLVAGAAVACPAPGRCDDRYGPPAGYDAPRAQDPYEDAYRDGYDAGYQDGQDAAGTEDYGPPDAPGVWEDERGLYVWGHRGDPCACAPPPCGCGAGEVRLSSSFFDGAGGVGPIPDGGYYGSGGYYYVAQGGGSAYAFAHASARASVSVRYHGGYHHKGGGKHW